jgi:F-box and leucine-rich repeat protein 4
MLTDNITMLNLSWTKLSQIEPLENLFSLSCKHLTVLKLDSCNYLNGYLLRVIAVNCTELTHLSLRSCTNVQSDHDLTNYCFNELKSLKKLISLDLYRTLCDQESVNEILFNCNQIKYLNLGSCIRINDFDEICKTISIYCKQIKSLDLWRAYSLTPKGIYLLANNCTDLEDLDLGWWLVSKFFIQIL